MYFSFCNLFNLLFFSVSFPISFILFFFLSSFFISLSFIILSYILFSFFVRSPPPPGPNFMNDGQINEWLNLFILFRACCFHRVLFHINWVQMRCNQIQLNSTNSEQDPWTLPMEHPGLCVTASPYYEYFYTFGTVTNFLYLFLSLLLSFFLALSLIIHSYFLFLFLLISFSRSSFHCFPKIIVVDHKNCLIQYRQSPDWWAVTFLKEISELFTNCPSLFNLNLNHHTGSTWVDALGHSVFQKYQNCKSAFFNLTECAECTLQREYIALLFQNK